MALPQQTAFTDMVDKFVEKNSSPYNYDIRGTGANWNLTSDEIKRLMNAIVANGGPLTDAQLIGLGLLDGGNHAGSARFKNIQQAMNQLIDNNYKILGYDSSGNVYNTEGHEEVTTPKDDALDKYFNEWYSGEEGTTGAKVRGELEGVFQNQANSEMMLADASFQQQALQQAQTVKAITDQVRAERMARLKAGMSESQIANQDMQMMMANVGALNDQATVLNQGRLQAQANSMNAKDQAYLAYLEQAGTGAQTGAAYSAANAGDLNYNVMNYLQKNYGNNWTKTQYDNALKLISGQSNS